MALTSRVGRVADNDIKVRSCQIRLGKVGYGWVSMGKVG